MLYKYSKFTTKITKGTKIFIVSILTKIPNKDKLENIISNLLIELKFAEHLVKYQKLLFETLNQLLKYIL